MSRIIQRPARRAPPVAVSAQGMLLRDSDGNTYIDACCAVSLLGYGQRDILGAIHRQVDRNAYAPPDFFSTDLARELAERLAADAPGAQCEVYLASGGLAAMEMALALARRFHAANGEHERCVLIARRQAHHGYTLGAASAMSMDVRRVAPCYEYRDRSPGQSVDDYTIGLLQELETAIVTAGPHKVAGFVADPVAGAIPPTPSYLRGVRAVCDKYQVLFIADETMCGMGRTGSMHALEQEDVVPDLVVVGEALGAGYQPIGAVLAQGRIAERIRAGSGAIQDDWTGNGHPVAIAAALAVQKVIERDGLLGVVRQRGEALRRMLHSALGKHECVGDIRGRGLLMGIELVSDRATRAPFDPARGLHATVQARAMANGLMVAATGGAADGRSSDCILLAPPFIASEANLADIVARLADSINQALAFGAP